jgi:hypothetical protein
MLSKQRWPWVLELQYASISTAGRKKDIVVGVYEGWSGAGILSTRTGNELTADRDFMMTVLKCDAGPMSRLVPNPCDGSRLLLALVHGMRRFCPTQAPNGPTFSWQPSAQINRLTLK